MPNPTWGSKPEHVANAKSAIAALEEFDGSTSQAARSLGVPETTLRRWANKGRAMGLDPHFIGGTPMGQSVKGVSTLYDEAGGVKAQWVKTQTDYSEDTVQTIKDAFLDLKGKSPKSLPTPKRKDKDLATVYMLADWHIGMLAWGKESGDDWDLDIAETAIRAAMSALFEYAPNSHQAVVLGLGDLLHFDSYDPVTSKSRNILDSDGRYPKVLKTAIGLLVYVIECALEKHGKVLVRNLPGNHDEAASIAITLALSAYYHKERRVTVDESPSRFWVWQWGTTLIAATHGDMAKMQTLPMWLASTHGELWGNTKHRAIYTGHIHKDTAQEVGGVRVESFRSPITKDAWHVGMGYQSGRSVSAITHHVKNGEVARHKVSL